jgi:MFS family permease
MILTRNGKNVGLLAVGQALNGSALTMAIIATPLAGLILAEDKALATLPSAMQWLFTMFTAYPASLIMRRIGRRAGFFIGDAFLILGGLLCILALIRGEFAFLWMGASLMGVSNGFAIFYRFAAADAVEPAWRGRAISYVLAGGLLAAFIGPQLGVLTKDLLAPATFAGCYVALIGIALVKMAVLANLRIPLQSVAERAVSGRPLLQIIAQPRYLIALACSMVGWGVMVLLMSSTPLAMQVCNHAFDDTAFVIQWHVVGMYAPSFFTGHLIRRFGLANILLMGAVLQAAAVTANLTGIEVWNFLAANFLQGMGWNFLFVGGSTLLTTTYRPEERARAQGAHDLLTMGVAAIAAFSSGALHHLVGWQVVNSAVIPLIVCVLAAILWLRYSPTPVAAE